MAEHNKAPWSHEDGGIYDADDQIIAQLGDPAEWSGDCFHPFDNYRANARLIAASPTLLEALEELEQRADEVVAALDKYNAENGTHLGGPPFFNIGVALAKARAAITLAIGKDA